MSKELEQKITELQKQLADALDGIEKVKQKNTDVILDNKKLKTKLSDIEKEKESAIKAATEQKLKDEGKLEELHKLQLEDLESRLEAKNTEVVTLSDELNISKSDIRKMVVDDGLVSSFMAAGVKDAALLKACVTLHSQRAEVKREDGKTEVLIDGKPVTEYIEAWKDGEGKSFISAGLSGGGAGGGGGGGAPIGDFEEYFKPETKNVTKQLELKEKDVELYNQLKKKYASPVNRYVAQ